MKLTRSLTLALATTIALAAPALAKKPENPGNSGDHKAAEHRASNDNRHDYDHYFDDDRRSAIQRYYVDHRSSAGCPPGLAKKNNGCQPPGQAKQWQIGRPLPGDVVYYDLPRELLHQLGRTPEGQKLVRVGTDILLISVGSAIVLDAIDNLDGAF